MRAVLAELGPFSMVRMKAVIIPVREMLFFKKMSIFYRNSQSETAWTKVVGKDADKLSMKLLMQLEAMTK